jgi:conjugative transfer pilus assembly protein TraH
MRCKRRHWRVLWATLCLGGFVTAKGEASTVGQDIEGFLHGLQEAHNITRPQVVHDQAGGFYTGGSLYARSPVHETPMVNMTLPSISAGCGGIDLFIGGFGFVNAEELKNALKNIANNSVNYAFMLGIDAVTPMIANEMHALQHWANDMNRMNIQSCETAATLVGGLWPKTDVAKRHVCQTLGTATNRFSDHTKARMGCANPKEYERTMTALKKDNTYGDIIVDNQNLAWQALQKTAVVSQSKSLAEWMQSLSGTVIVLDQNGRRQEIVLPSLLENTTAIASLLYGGEFLFYQCDEEKACLHPKKVTMTMTEEESLLALVKKELQGVYQHIMDDSALTDSQRRLIERTSLPLLKLLTVEAAYTHRYALTVVEPLAEIVALELLETYLETSVQWMAAASQQLFLSDSEHEHFFKGIERAQRVLKRFQTKTHHEVWQRERFIQRSRLMEEQLTGRLTSSMVNVLSASESR